MKQVLAITGVAAAATLTLGGLLVAMSEPVEAKQHRHARPAAARSHRHVKHYHHPNRAGHARRQVVNITGSGAVFAPGYCRAPGGLTIRF